MKKTPEERKLRKVPSNLTNEHIESSKQSIALKLREGSEQSMYTSARQMAQSMPNMMSSSLMKKPALKQNSNWKKVSLLKVLKFQQPKKVDLGVETQDSEDSDSIPTPEKNLIKQREKEQMALARMTKFERIFVRNQYELRQQQRSCGKKIFDKSEQESKKYVSYKSQKLLSNNVILNSQKKQSFNFIDLSNQASTSSTNNNNINRSKRSSVFLRSTAEGSQNGSHESLNDHPPSRLHHQRVLAKQSETHFSRFSGSKPVPLARQSCIMQFNANTSSENFPSLKKLSKQSTTTTTAFNVEPINVPKSVPNLLKFLRNKNKATSEEEEHLLQRSSQMTSSEGNRTDNTNFNAQAQVPETSLYEKTLFMEILKQVKEEKRIERQNQQKRLQELKKNLTENKKQRVRELALKCIHKDGVSKQQRDGIRSDFNSIDHMNDQQLLDYETMLLKQIQTNNCFEPENRKIRRSFRTKRTSIFSFNSELSKTHNALTVI